MYSKDRHLRNDLSVSNTQGDGRGPFRVVVGVVEAVAFGVGLVIGSLLVGVILAFTV